MSWHELNSVESLRFLSNILTQKEVSLEAKSIRLSGIKSYYASIHPRLYGLHKYADRYFIGLLIKRLGDDVVLYIVSSNGEPIDRAIDVLRAGQVQIREVKELQPKEIDELVKAEKYALLDSYFKLALRNYLHRAGFELRITGRRTLWSKTNDDTLYSLDADLDPDTLKGYVSVDMKIPSSTTLWDEVVSRGMSVQGLWDYIDANVMVPYGKRYAYGRIRGFIPKKVSETITLNGERLNLFDYYAKKGVQLDPSEHPIVEVEIVSPEPRSPRPLYYPPSQVRLFLPGNRPDPHTRYDKINGVLSDLIKNFNLFGIGFKRAIVRYTRCMDMIKGVRLKYGDRESHISPLYSMQKLNSRPLRGPVDIPELVMLLPKSVKALDSGYKAIEVVKKLIQLVYKEYNLGSIKSVVVDYYEVCDDVDRQKVEFSMKLSRLLEGRKPTETLIMPVISRRYLFKLAKQICSDRSFHARVVEEETFTDMVRLVEELGIGDEEGIKRKLEALRKVGERGIEEGEDKQLKRLASVLSNIVFSIYVEFILQSEIYEHRVPGTLTWALAEPADGVGESLYIGYDVSRSPAEKREIAVAFVLYDSYGYMLNATLKQVHGERLTSDVLESILLSLFTPLVHRLRTSRLVIYKDGGVRSRSEFEDIVNAFSRIGEKTGFREMDVVGVIKRHNLRLFEKGSRGAMVNPKMGTWVKVWSVLRRGVYAERALVVSSEAKAGTVRPVLLERYGSKKTSSRGIDGIVGEYLKLCRLNYWNPLNGLNKFPLPLFMADKLAYLALQGVQVKTP